MKTNRIATLASTLCVAMAGYTQTEWHSLPGGNVIGSTEYLGAAGGSTVPLLLKTVAIQPIDFYTANEFRARINERLTYTLLGTFPNIVADGFTLITPSTHFLAFPPQGPFSRLHLAEGTGENMQNYGYRPWQRNGITFTGNADQGYIGQKYGAEDETDMVIQWSDNPDNSEYGTDRMRFLFTGGYNGSTTGMYSLEGLEGMRLWPKNDKEINVGIGDFYADGSDPTERLHILNGRLRIEQLPNDQQDTSLYKYMVVDDAGVVHWRYSGNGGGGCEWTLQVPGTNSNVATAFTGNPGCPQMDKGVGIGIAIPKAKLDVYHTDFTSLQRTAIQGMINPNSLTQSFIGLYGVCSPVSTSLMGLNGYGVLGTAVNTRNMYGVRGDAILTAPSASWVIGTYGKATIVPGSTYNLAAGVVGEVDTPYTANKWAGFFHGPVQITGSLYHGSTFIFSDSSLKTDVQAVADPTEQLAALSPSSYSYTTEAQHRLGVPSGEQFGFIAQQVEEVFPQLVSSTQVPAVLDSLGNEVEPSMELKAVNYVGLIPLLVAGMQEQQATIAQLQAQIDQCCSTQINGMAPQEEGNGNSAVEESNVQEQRLLVQPNPFTDHTTLEYYVPRAGKVSLQVSGSDGRTLGTLREEQADAGAYSYVWNTTQLAPGTYFCALLVDGKVVVKKAVKVAR